MNHDLAGQLYPEEVSAYVVAHLLAAAELQLDADVSKAVISVPAYFGEAQRDATVTAGRIAGLDTVKLIRCSALPMTKLELNWKRCNWSLAASQSMPSSLLEHSPSGGVIF